jgi:hypothetical protein
MAFLWLHSAFEDDRLVHLRTLKEAYDAGIAFIRLKLNARVIPFEQIENSIASILPIAEAFGHQIIIGYGSPSQQILEYFNRGAGVIRCI